MLYIAENLKALRKEKEWTQEEMAEAIGVSPQSVSKWERGDTYPDITLLPTLANLFNVSVDAIIGMDRINEEEARTAIFKSGQEQLRNGNRNAAEEIFSKALKTFPSDEGLMLELAIVLALDNDGAKLEKAVNLCQRVLSGNPTEKVRHTTRATICLIYFKQGDKDKANCAAENLPHIRESRENILAEFRDEPEDIDSYLRFIALGEKDNQFKVLVEFGIDMVVMFTSECDLLERIKKLRKESGAEANREGLRKLPHVRVRDNVELPTKRVKVSYYADSILDKDFDDPKDAVDEIIQALKEIIG